VTIDIRNVRFWGNSGHVRVPWNFTRCMLALSPEQAAPLWQAAQTQANTALITEDRLI
jgi:hypothetical protein